MGWLDNYGKEENYNDSHTSAPEGFEGDGYSNVGRNYSPAWGGQFEEGGEIPQAQFGLPISPIMPLVSGVANKFNDWFGDEPAKKPVKKPAKGKPRTLSIVDPRKKMATTNQPLRPNSDLVGGEYNSKHLDKLMQEAKRQKLSKQDMLNLSAMGFQETKWGKSDGNIGHTLGKWEGDDSYRRFISAYKAKMKESDRLGIKDPATRLQVYNGMGTVTPKTESKYHGFEMQKIYGVPIPKGGIDMAKNPLYGKQVMDIRDNVLAKNPEYMRYMDSISKAPAPTYRDIEDERRQMFATNPSLHLLMPERVAPPPPRLEMSGSRKQQARQNKLIDNGPSGASGSFPRTQGFAPLVAPKLAPLKKNEMGGSVYPVNYVPQEQFQMGGNLPGATGHMYARYNEGGEVDYPRTKGIPSNGPYAKKTMASAQNGTEMRYYQNGLDWKPKGMRKGGIIKDDRGQWDHPGEITEIGSNNITMEGVPYPVLGISDTGHTQMMYPGNLYKFKGKKVTEYPIAKNGVNQADENSLVKLDQLTNFTNYNTKQPGGWLDTL